MSKRRYFIATITIVFFALVLRLWKLDLNPIGLVHDEIHQIVNAKSIWLTGHGAAGTGAGVWQNDPYCDGNCVFGELPTLLLIPFAWIPGSFPWVKLPFVIASLGLVLGVMKLWENLIQKKEWAILAGLMVAINPWAINFGRTAYENIFAFLFYMWSLVFFTDRNFYLKKQVIGLVFGFLASLSYFGAKPIFVPLMLVGLIYGWWMENWKNKNKYIFLGLLAMGIMLIYAIVLKNSFAGIRLGETKLMSPEISQLVNENRRLTLNLPTVIRDLAINKYTILAQILLKKYLAPLAPNFLFNEGEVGYDHFMIAGHAFMYLVDAPLMVVGWIALLFYSVPAAMMILGVILVLPITPMVSNYASTYALRCGLLYPLLAGLAGSGAWFLVSKIKSEIGKKTVVVGLIIVYGLSLANFLLMYWFRNPLEKSAGWVFFERQAIKYIELAKEKNAGQKFWMTTSDPVDMIYEYAVFSGRVNNPAFLNQMNSSIKSRNYEVDGIVFSKTCPSQFNKQTIYIVSAGLDCVKNTQSEIRIAEPRDTGARWYLLNDSICNRMQLQRYPYPRILTDFKVEPMRASEFCQKWISWPK